MKKFLLQFVCCLIAVAAVCMASGCSLKEAATNRENLKKIRIGMTQEQVRTIMGEPLDEVYSRPNIWFYFTEHKWFDGMNTRDECTPVMFDENKTVCGVGYDYYKKALNKEDNTRRLLDEQL